jgi:hypothetical protein
VWTCDNGDLPPWKGDYHNDLNTQMTYLAYLEAGLFQQGESFLNFNEKLLAGYRGFARSFYDIPGAVVPGVMTLDGKALGGWGQHSLSPTHSAWIAQSFYLHWRYTGDPEFLPLPRVPVLRGSGGGAARPRQARCVGQTQAATLFISRDLRQLVPSLDAAKLELRPLPSAIHLHRER